MKRFLTGCLTVLLSALPAFARVGETREELTKRHGAGKELGDSMIYRAGEYDLSVYFNGKNSNLEIYTPVKDADGTGRPFKATEIDQLLTEQAGRSSWQQTSSQGGETQWRRRDGLMRAKHQEDKNIMVFFSVTP